MGGIFNTFLKCFLRQMAHTHVQEMTQKPKISLTRFVFLQKRLCVCVCVPSLFLLTFSRTICNPLVCIQIDTCVLQQGELKLHEESFYTLFICVCI